MFRMFRSSYRQARHPLKSVLTGSQPSIFEERLEILDLLNQRQIAKTKLTEAATVGEKAFGRFWLGPQTDWKRISNWEAWDELTTRAGAAPRFRSMLSLLDRKDEIQQLADDVRRKLDGFVTNYKSLCESLKRCCARCLAASGIGNIRWW